MQIEGWDLKKLEDVVSAEKYSMVDGPFGSNLKSEHYRTTGIPVLQSGFVTSGKFLAESYVYVDEKLFEEQKRSSAKGGDILMAKIGAQAGRCAIIPKEHPQSIIAGNCLKLTFDEKTSSTDFFYMILTFNYDKNGLSDIKTETAQPAISLKSLKAYKVPVPPLPEQKKIAEILSTWDKAIETVEKLVANSQQQKKALMQQLLTGQKRLLDDNGMKFGDEWEEFSVSDLCKIGRGRVISKNEIQDNSGIYPVYSSQTLNNGIMGYLNTFDFDGEYVTWTTDGVNAGTIFYRNGKFNCTNVCGTLSPKSDLINLKFLALALSRVAFKYVSHTLANPKLMNGVMGTITIRIPPIKEQEKIAQVLTLADREIDLYQQQLDKLKLEKKALMQQLLTGQKRVKID